MIDSRTIIAPASASGRGGISVIRMSGPLSKKIAKEMCGELAEPWRFKKCNITSNNGSLIDVGMVVFFKSPYSYTGEDVVEFHCHGNPMIVNLTIESALVLGAVVAEPGEFTKKAFLNDKIDLAQAESVADLINAQSESAIIAANSSLSGDFSKQVNGILDELTEARVFIEANIDFPDEDIDKTHMESLNEKLIELLGVVSGLLTSVQDGMKLREGYSVAIVGPPNAGKSTLLNLLARERVAITSDIEGTTRDLVKVPVNVAGLVIEFIDTAGIRDDPENSIEEEGISKSKEVINKSNITLVVQDSTSVKPFNVELGESIVVMNKSDLMKESQPNDKNTFYVSSVSGEGIPELLSELIKKLEVDEGSETVFLSRKRHEECLVKGRDFINESLEGLRHDLGLELIAENLKESHNALGEILRPMSSDDLLGEIFSEFCIGK